MLDFILLKLKLLFEVLKFVSLLFVSRFCAFKRVDSLQELVILFGNLDQLLAFRLCALHSLLNLKIVAFHLLKQDLVTLLKSLDLPGALIKLNLLLVLLLLQFVESLFLHLELLFCVVNLFSMSLIVLLVCVDLQ